LDVVGFLVWAVSRLRLGWVKWIFLSQVDAAPCGCGWDGDGI